MTTMTVPVYAVGHEPLKGAMTDCLVKRSFPVQGKLHIPEYIRCLPYHPMAHLCQFIPELDLWQICVDLAFTSWVS